MRWGDFYHHAINSTRHKHLTRFKEAFVKVEVLEWILDVLCINVHVLCLFLNKPKKITVGMHSKSVYILYSYFLKLIFVLIILFLKHFSLTICQCVIFAARV